VCNTRCSSATTDVATASALLHTSFALFTHALYPLPVVRASSPYSLPPSIAHAVRYHARALFYNR
jgi:hypothetical protein